MMGRRLTRACLGVFLLASGCASDTSTSSTEVSVNTSKTGQNRLAHETSPYLLQHADNPVDWYPWGDEAFAKAKETGKPILVSIGYSSCHWCHVMEHESFEDPAAAAVMNELFVCVKVDREERPDVDEIYMTATQMMGMGGGWPLNVFLTPDGVPFFGGTYFPPAGAYGRPGWTDVLRQIAEAWETQRDQILQQGDQVLAALNRNSEFPGSDTVPEVALVAAAVDQAMGRFDPKFGGFNGQPKFPPHQTLELLLRWYKRLGDASHLHFVEFTLRKMAEGGMYDQLGGGFHRYSVDEEWLVPHFEKMLYDNAQLARVYVEAFQVTRNPLYERIARETLDYVLREMTEPEGGFRSATDADSDGREGVYFVWKDAEFDELLDAKDAALARAFWGVTAAGNFADPHHPTPPGEQGMNVLHVAQPLADAAAAVGMSEAEAKVSLEKSRKTLLAHRQGRTYPGLDDKILSGWNGLMIGSMAYAGRALGEPRYLDAAEKAGEFVLGEMRTKDGRLLRTHRAGRSKIGGFLDDHAFMASACLDLYESNFDPKWFVAATELAAAMNGFFTDEATGGWFHTASDADELLTRTRNPYDGAEPSGNGVATQVMVRLSKMTGEAGYQAAAESALRTFTPVLERQPAGTVSTLMALEMLLYSAGEIAFVGRPGDSGTRGLVAAVHEEYLPGTVMALLAPGDEATAQLIPLLEGKVLVDDHEAAYVCRNFTCRAPVTTAEALRQAVAEL
ncbi:MAG: thioredoxin domain-containing protein [Gemmatimonadota bacterium]|nr:MAG: thioredoxin domain-containing protein [Gemmatimonadota bacterium]